jgi:TolB-like protein/DNA-binding winged helix-turn-helix (wHTH) protein/Tfp pilus assembly protein PilF
LRELYLAKPAPFLQNGVRVLPGKLMPPPASVYRFASFELRPRTRELYKHGVKLKLRPQPLRVLEVLLDRRGDMVTREELHRLLWESETFVDFEQGLNTAVKELRASLSDSADTPRYVETIPRLGYRIIVPVEVEISPAAPPAEPSQPPLETKPAPPAPPDPPVAGAQPEPPARTRPLRARFPLPARWTAIAAIAGAAVIILATYWALSHKRVAAQPPSARLMLAVLPFENLTGDAGQDYFSDGLTEEMIAQLGRHASNEFGVIARTSVMHYKHTSSNIDQIGRELGVRYILEGSVRRNAGEVRINAQLIETGTQTPLWTKEYNRELTNLLGLQEEIAHEISDAIQVTLGKRAASSAEHKPALTPRAYQAYDLYLRGLFFWNKRTLPGFEQAIQYFQQAIAEDPNYAPAYAGLANSYTLLTGYSLVPASRYMPKARAAAMRAVELDDSLAEAHTALALIIENYDWDWDGSEKEYLRAIALNPNYATAHQWFAEQLTWRKHFDEALRESEEARRLDPLSLIITSDHAAILYYSRQYDQAIAQFGAVQDMDPDFPRAQLLINAYIEQGRYSEAIAGLQRWRSVYGDGPADWEKMSYCYCRSGQPGKAKEELKKLEQANGKRTLDPSILVVPNFCVGNVERAFALLTEAHAQHSNALTTLNVEPAYDPMRSDPRFQELLHQVGLVQ